MSAEAQAPPPQTEPSPPPDEPAAPRIPGYEILGRLGQGGMGVVYRARQLSLNRVVALKLLAGGAQSGPDARARFRREAEAIARLAHPNIVQVHEVGQAEAGPYLVLEYVSGGSLAERLRGAPQPAPAAAEMLLPLANAVEHAHSQGILHRDLKPANVLLQPLTAKTPRTPREEEKEERKKEARKVAGSGGTAEQHSSLPSSSGLGALGGLAVSSFILKITDFGLAKLLPAGGTPVPEGGTTVGNILGTPSYMAPEQASGVTRHLTPACDVYALGAILYEMLTGRPPFLAEGPVETVLRVLSDDPVPPRRLNPAVPRDLETVCLKCLHKEPRKRYAGAGELAQDVERFLAGRPVLARPAGRAERLLKWARRRPALAALVAVTSLAVLSGLAGAGWYQLRLARANSDLRDALGRERRQKERNDQLLRLSMDVMSSYGSFVDEQAASTPALRRKLAEGRLRFYEPFLRQAPTDPEMRYRYAFALMETAIARYRMGGPKDLAEAERLFGESAEVWESLMDEFPGEREYRRRAALVEYNTGLQALLQGRTDRAARAFRRAAELLGGLEGTKDFTPADARTLAGALYYLGKAAADAGRADEAQGYWLREASLIRGLLADSPRDAGLHAELGLALGQVADLYQARARLSGPGKPAPHPHPAGTVLQNLSDLVLWQGCRKASARYFREGVGHLREAVRLDGTKRGPHAALGWQGTALAALGAQLRDAGALAEGADALADSAAGEGLKGDALVSRYLKAAAFMAEAVALTPEGEARPREQRAARAVRILAMAAKAGFRNAAALRAAPQLAPLRGRADLRRLLAALEAEGRTGK